jgi:hypothetical protein
MREVRGSKDKTYSSWGSGHGYSQVNFQKFMDEFLTQNRVI